MCELLQSNDNKKELGSLILGTSVANLSIRDLKDNVVFSLKNMTPIAVCILWLICSTTTFTVRFLISFSSVFPQPKENITCVFWDFNQNGEIPSII